MTKERSNGIYRLNDILVIPFYFLFNYINNKFSFFYNSINRKTDV